jgi:hypothetical protein
MMNQLYGHGFSTPWTFERVFSKSIEEGLGEGFSGQNMIASGVRWNLGWFEAFQARSNVSIADVSKQSIVSEALESFGSDEIHPPIGVALSIGQTETGLAGKGDASGFSHKPDTEIGRNLSCRDHRSRAFYGRPDCDTSWRTGD